MNVYNSNPIKIDTAFTSGWRSLQTLNTGNLPSHAQQFSGSVTRQPGIRVHKIIWTGVTAQGHQVIVQDPNDSTLLFQAQMGTTLEDIIRDWEKRDAEWRDFKVPTISSGILLIYYR